MAADSVYLGQSTKPEVLYLALANRHGLITGATGTGKTVTLQTLAQGFSNAGVPVFAADVKGDLAGLGMAGTPEGFITDRLAKIGVTDWKPQAAPVIFWDLFGEQGHPVRTTITEMGSAYRKPRKVHSTSPFALPMRRGLPFSISKTCAPCFRNWRIVAAKSEPIMAMSPLSRSAPSSAR